jgi:UDP-N-acetyl-D-mannosaminuronic acid dehydrogenase
MSKVCVVGLGYIGLPTAAMLASRGHEVIGCDINQTAIDMINDGKPHFHEPDLQMLLTAAVQTGCLTAQREAAQAEYFILAVPTPFKEGGKPDLSYVDAATDLISPVIKRGDTIILESTSPVGATQAMAERLSHARPDLRLPRFQAEGVFDIRIAHCPERVMPGQMVRELLSNDRIIGGMTDDCAKSAQALYESFTSGEITLTDCRTAEFVKLIENASRDVSVAFANELSLICDDLKLDVWHAIELANKHPRVNILRPSAGVGGHCIAVDPLFIIDAVPNTARLIRMAREVNDSKPNWVCEKILKLTPRFRDPVLASFGITYKPDVDDIRESPALKIVQNLAHQSGARILVVEPNICELPPSLSKFNNVSLANIETAREEADIMAFLVAHRQFKKLDKRQFLNKVVVDAVGLMA